MHMNTSEATNPQWEHETFAPFLKATGYTTSYVGMLEGGLYCEPRIKRRPHSSVSSTVPPGLCNVADNQANTSTPCPKFVARENMRRAGTTGCQCAHKSTTM